jgi:5-methylcytosine-specific restriction enzyme subunit McrC
MSFDPNQDSVENIRNLEKIPIRNLWYILLYAWREPPPVGSIGGSDFEKAPTLDGLLCSMLGRLMQQRLRIGLGRNYKDRSEVLSMIRGKLNFSESIKRTTFEKGKAFCQYQDFSINVPRNQIIRTTLMRMVQLGDFGIDDSFARETRQMLRMVSKIMDGIDFIELQLDSIHRIQLSRNDRDYRIMLAICELFLQRNMPINIAGQLRLPEFERRKLTMYQIFEDFISNFYRYHLRDWNVLPQKTINWHVQKGNQYLPDMRPDLVLIEKDTNRIIILDTKYASPIVQNRWGGEKFQSSHMYQMYAYLKTQESHSEYHSRAQGILLYPTNRTANTNEKMVIENHEISIRSIDLSNPWQDIERDLIQMIVADH